MSKNVYIKEINEQWEYTNDPLEAGMFSYEETQNFFQQLFDKESFVVFDMDYIDTMCVEKLKNFK